MHDLLTTLPLFKGTHTPPRCKREEVWSIKINKCIRKNI